MSCTAILPIAVASTGPAVTFLPVTSAVNLHRVGVLYAAADYMHYVYAAAYELLQILYIISVRHGKALEYTQRVAALRIGQPLGGALEEVVYLFLHRPGFTERGIIGVYKHFGARFGLQHMIDILE